MSPTIRFHVTGFGESLSEAPQTDFYIKNDIEETKEDIMAKFCGKCGNPIEMCTCGSSKIDAIPKAPVSRPKISYSTVVHLDEIALGEGEQKVKEYILGKYPFSCGDVRLVVTNKRVILKEEYSFLFLSHNRIEELNLESVHGVNGNIGRGMNKIMFFIGLFLTVGSAFAGALILSTMRGYYHNGGASTFLLIFGIALMVLSCLFPYMTFGIIGMGSDHQSLMTGININGKTALNNGVIFQPRPSSDARKSIAEAGACIFDLRTYGDEAIEKWTR